MISMIVNSATEIIIILSGTISFLNLYSCHYSDYRQLVAAGLAGATSKYDLDWLIAYTQNSQKLIYDDKDPIAIRLHEEYNKVLMPIQPVTDKEVIAIFEYVDGLKHESDN